MRFVHIGVFSVQFIAKRRKEDKEKEAAIVPGGAKPSNVAQRIGYTGQRGRQEF